MVGKDQVLTLANVLVNLAPGFRALSEEQVIEITDLLATDAITYAQAREVLEAIDGTDASPSRLVDEWGIRQSTDADALAMVVDEVLAGCADQVLQYRTGNTKVLGFLVGQCMKASKGSGNPKMFNRLLRERLRG